MELNSKYLTVHFIASLISVLMKKSSHKLSQLLIDKVMVLTVPGVEFGMEGYIRLSLLEQLKKSRKELKELNGLLIQTHQTNSILAIENL